MAAFDSTKTALKDLLDDIVAGKIQLPGFQRGWIWDDEHINPMLTTRPRSSRRDSKRPDSTHCGRARARPIADYTSWFNVRVRVISFGKRECLSSTEMNGA